MKLKQVESIVKASKRIHILNAHNGCQWLGNDSAFYPLYDMPTLTENNIFTMLDIPEDSRNKFKYTDSELPSEYNFSDIEENERIVGRSMFWLVARGSVVEPFNTSLGIQFIDTKYLKPFDSDNYELYERIGQNGKVYIVVKCGFFIQGVIYPHDILDEKLIDALEKFTAEAKKTFCEKNISLCEQLCIDGTEESADE